jgi:hypothetical protein
LANESALASAVSRLGSIIRCHCTAGRIRKRVPMLPGSGRSVASLDRCRRRCQRAIYSHQMDSRKATLRSRTLRAVYQAHLDRRLRCRSTTDRPELLNCVLATNSYFPRVSLPRHPPSPWRSMTGDSLSTVSGIPSLRSRRTIAAPTTRNNSARATCSPFSCARMSLIHPLAARKLELQVQSVAA